jgi:hypothetical protein
VLVDVRVRVTPYRAVGDGGTRPAPQAQPDGPVRSAGLVSPASETADRATDAAETETEPDVLGVPAAAPAPTGRGWRGCASYWVRLSVPVVRENGRLVVDAAEEAGPDVDDARAHGTSAEVRELRAEPPAADPEPVRLPPAPEPERAW